MLTRLNPPLPPASGTVSPTPATNAALMKNKQQFYGHRLTLTDNISLLNAMKEEREGRCDPLAAILYCYFMS